MDWSKSDGQNGGRGFPRWTWLLEIAIMTLVGLMAADTLREKPLMIKTAWPLKQRRKWGVILLIFAISAMVVGLIMFLR